MLSAGKTHIYARILCISRVYKQRTTETMVVVVSVVVCKGEKGECSFGRLGNKVFPDEKAHVFTFSIYRSPAREIVTRKCRSACACHADRFKSRTCRIYKCASRLSRFLLLPRFPPFPRVSSLPLAALAPRPQGGFIVVGVALSSRDANWKKVHVELDRENCACTLEKHVSNKMRLNDCHVKKLIRSVSEHVLNETASNDRCLM